jgi:hypothetical protein
VGVISFPAQACSYFGSYVFQPTLERWEQHPGPKQLDENASGDYWEAVPLPVVSQMAINRASYNGKTSCGDTGDLTILVKLPSSSTYNLDEFGVYIQVIDGEMPDQIFPNIPIIDTTPETDEGFYSFTFGWLDHHPSEQAPLNLTIEVRFLTNDLRLGAATTIKIKQDDSY